MIRLSKRLLFVVTCLMLTACGQGSTETGQVTLERCDPYRPWEAACQTGIPQYQPYTPRSWEVTYVSVGTLADPPSSSSSGGSNSSSGGTRSNTASSSGDPYENYVDKYPDLLAAFNSGAGGGQSKSAWGKAHFCGSGRIEGRSYSGLSSASCGASLCRGGGESASNSGISSSSSSPSSSSSSSSSSASSSAVSCSAPSVSPSSSTASSSTHSSSTPRLSSGSQGGR